MVAEVSEEPSAARICRAYQDARAEGWVVNTKKILHLWRGDGLRAPAAP